MDTSGVSVLVAVTFAVVAVVVVLVFRQRARIGIKGPLGMQLDVEGSNAPSPVAKGIIVEDARSLEGGLHATDDTAGGVEARRIETKTDIELTSRAGVGSKNPKASRRKG